MKMRKTSTESAAESRVMVRTASIRAREMTDRCEFQIWIAGFVLIPANGERLGGL
ncbi:hypothetical protein [Burkholderia ubonensis]|uniref:hypothetical protein n=1 Tax=Burkholderia ubonensis TaxID=101571 RepID=UPI0015828171|nr:hypothetical protein [Burkholderia ubonensis]